MAALAQAGCKRQLSRVVGARSGRMIRNRPTSVSPVTDDVTRFEGETLEVVATRSAERLDVRLHGELDMGCCDLLTAAFAAVDLTGVTYVTVDLGELQFVDSCGVQAFLQIRARQMQAGRRVRFSSPRTPVQRVFRVLGIDALLTAEPVATNSHPSGPRADRREQPRTEDDSD
jgi:anti-anti-sigma factor